MKSHITNKIVELDNKKYLVDEETGELKEILSDKSPIGKERPWARHKKENMTVEQAYRGLSKCSAYEPEYWEKKADRLNGCGRFLTFNVYQTEDGRTMKVKHAESCRVRLCPVCSWRRSVKIHTHMRKIIENMQREDEYEYLLITLTVPNVTADKLNSKIDDLMTAWNRLQTYSRYKTAVKGWYRGLEITHNVNPLSPSYDTYHPHFHCIAVVLKRYFKGKEYIKQEEWLEMWRKATRNSNITQVDVRKVKPKKGADPNDIIGAVCEVTKYTVKNGDYILPKDWKMTLDSVEVLDKALAKRRLVAFGGVMKEWHKKLNLDDEIDGDLIEDSEDINGDVLGELTFCWHVGYQQYLKSD